MISSLQTASAAISANPASPNTVHQASSDKTQIASASDGPDRENDGDSDDIGATTATRGKNLNITA